MSVNPVALASPTSLVNPAFQGQRLIEYNSPTIVIAAVVVVLFFSSVSCSSVVCKIAEYCVPFTFSIYLIHEQPLVRRLLIYDCMLPILEYSPILQPIAVFGAAAIIWVACFCLEYIRQIIFRWLGINRLLHCINQRSFEGEGRISEVGQ